MPDAGETLYIGKGRYKSANSPGKIADIVERPLTPAERWALEPYDCPDGTCKDKCQDYKDRVAKGETVHPHSDLHNARNVCNQCPRIPPIFFRKGWIQNTYRDHAGRFWNGELGSYHDNPDWPDARELTVRDQDGAGFQCRYVADEQGNWSLDDSSPYMGTFDYQAPGLKPANILSHRGVDVIPHNTDPTYIPNLTTVY